MQCRIHSIEKLFDHINMSSIIFLEGKIKIFCIKCFGTEIEYCKYGQLKIVLKCSILLENILCNKFN